MSEGVTAATPPWPALAPSRAHLEELGLTVRFFEIRCDGHLVNRGRRVKHSRLAFATHLEFPDGDERPWMLAGTLASAVTVRTRQLASAPARRHFERSVDAMDGVRRREVLECSSCGSRAVFANLAVFRTTCEHLWLTEKRVVSFSEFRTRYAALTRISPR